MEQSSRPAQFPWTVPVTVAEIPDGGAHYDLVADAAERESVARLAELRALPSLSATFDVTRKGEGVAVRGEVRAKVGQTCVITLEPVEGEVVESVDLVFAPPSGVDAAAVKTSTKKRELSEPLENGVVDLGAIVTEFLMLGIDPYPRKPGVAFSSPSVDDDKARPFAALEKLKKSNA